MIYPDKINKNETIGVTATSMGITNNFDKERLTRAINKINKLGYNVINTNNVFSNYKFTSSDPKTRAKEFLDLWKNKDIKVISLVRGGELLNEIIPYIDDKIILNNSPKWVFGYSDSSLLNLYLTTKYNIATINSSNILQFSINNLDRTFIDIFKCFNEKEIVQESFKRYEKEKLKNSFNYNLTGKVLYKSLYNNDVTIKGILLGGCLEAITEILGTKYDFVYQFVFHSSDKILWYLDIYDSDPLTLYRKLWQMKEANWFYNISGVIIGRTKSVKRVGDFTYLDSLHRIFDDMNIPVIYDVDIGHVMPQFSIINGSLGTFIYKNNKGILKQEKFNE